MTLKYSNPNQRVETYSKSGRNPRSGKPGCVWQVW